MTSTKKIIQPSPAKQAFRLKIAVLAIAACFAPLAMANPVGPVVVNGAATVVNNGNNMTVTNTPGAILNWQQFNIGQGQTTQFNQQSAQSSVLNRVTGPDASQIMGTLRSNGQVFLINPNGIMFGAGSVVDVNRLVASTLNITNADFLANNLKFNGNNGTSVVNQGQITTPFGGSVYLIGNNVTNEGVITTPQGEVVLAAGNSVSMVNTVTPHVSVTVTAGGQALNLGQITAQGGSIDIYGALVQQQGIVSADSAAVDTQGNIVLSATQSVDVAAGSTTSATNSNGNGGSVQILGNQVNVAGGVDVSGSAGGGTILVGGDYQGNNPNVQNALSTTVANGATLKADATLNGNGGKVVVWADNTATFAGDISAGGGSLSGNGGNVEVSGKGVLNFKGIVNTLAPAGQGGSLLLDPYALCIATTSGTSSSCGWQGIDPLNPTATTYPQSYLTPSQITALVAANAATTIQTNNYGGGGALLITDPIIFSAGQLTGGRSLTLQADNGTFYQNPNATIDARSGGGALNLAMNAPGVGGSFQLSGSVYTNGGNFSAESPYISLVPQILGSGVYTSGGSVNLLATGSLYIGDSTGAMSATVDAAAGSIAMSGSAVTIYAGSTVTGASLTINGASVTPGLFSTTWTPSLTPTLAQCTAAPTTAGCSTVLAAFFASAAGNYSGTWMSPSGAAYSGTWTTTISSSGLMTMTINSPGLAPITGTGQLLGDGTFSITAGTFSMSGSVNSANGTVSGTWISSPVSGTFTGQVVTLPPAVNFASTAGSYTGTSFTNTGAFDNTFTITLSSSGLITMHDTTGGGTGQLLADGSFTGTNTWTNTDGTTGAGTFSGSVNETTGVISGTWVDTTPPFHSGTFTGQRSQSQLQYSAAQTCLTNPTLCAAPAVNNMATSTMPVDTAAASGEITYGGAPDVTAAPAKVTEIAKARDEARKADDEAQKADEKVKEAKTPQEKAAASQHAEAKSSEADAKRADAKIHEADAEHRAAEAEVKSAKTSQEKARAEMRKAVAESKRAEGEVDKAAAEAKQADAEAKSAKTPAAKAVAEAKKSAAETKKSAAEVKQAEVETRKAETEVKQAEVEAKTTGAPEAKAAVEIKKAEVEAKKAEAEVKRAEAEVKSAKAPAEKAKAEEKVAVAEAKKADVEARKAETEAKHAEEKAKASDSPVEKRIAEVKKAEAETKKAEVEVKKAEVEAKTAKNPQAKKEAESKVAKAEAKKADLEAKKADSEVKVAEDRAKASGSSEARKEVESKKAEAEVKKADAQVKKADAEVKTAKGSEKDAAEIKHAEAEVKKVEAEVKHAEHEAKRDKEEASAPQSGYLKKAVEKKAEAAVAKVEAKKAELEVKKLVAEVKQAEVEIKEAKTPEARVVAEKRFEAKRGEMQSKEQKVASLKAEADQKETAFNDAKRSSDSRIIEVFGGMSLASTAKERVQDAMVARHEFMKETLKPALNILKANPNAADLKPCGASGGDVCMRPVNPALANLAVDIMPRVQLPVMTPKTSFLPGIQRKVAVVIGNNAYQDPNIPSLNGAVKDADAVGKVFKEKMGYDVRVVHNGTRADIVRTLNQISDETGSKDSVVVYYAGHGYQMEDTKVGYWIPSDASTKDPSNWISNSDINKMLTNIPAKQMILMSDSCFSGALTKEQQVTSSSSGKDVQEILAKRSVLVMSSGGEEPVMDEGRDGHSVFAWHLMDKLNNVEQYKNGADVFDAVKAGVAKDGIPQTPQYGASISAGHTAGGEYLFEVRKY